MRTSARPSVTSPELEKNISDSQPREVALTTSLSFAHSALLSNFQQLSGIQNA